MDEMPRRVSIGLRVNSSNPGHTRVSVFIGRNEGSRGHSGELVLRTDEWEELQDLILTAGLAADDQQFIDTAVDVMERFDLLQPLGGDDE